MNFFNEAFLATTVEKTLFFKKGDGIFYSIKMGPFL